MFTRCLITVHHVEECKPKTNLFPFKAPPPWPKVFIFFNSMHKSQLKHIYKGTNTTSKACLVCEAPPGCLQLGSTRPRSGFLAGLQQEKGNPGKPKENIKPTVTNRVNRLIGKCLCSLIVFSLTSFYQSQSTVPCSDSALENLLAKSMIMIRGTGIHCGNTDQKVPKSRHTRMCTRTNQNILASMSRVQSYY